MVLQASEVGISDGGVTIVLPSTESQATEGPNRDRIRQIIRDHAGLRLDFDKVVYSTDLYRAGMTSYASVALMIALENEFELEFPDAMLSRSVFESIDSIASAIESLQRVPQ
jgi:acyl carrier protein